MGKALTFAFDANIAIYLIEGEPSLRERITQRVRQLAGEAGAHYRLSPLLGLECTVKPLRERDRDTLIRFASLFTRPNVRFDPIDNRVIATATRFRADFSFRTPDAIILAGAKLARVDYFLTSDVVYRRCDEVRVESIDPAVA